MSIWRLLIFGIVLKCTLPAQNRVFSFASAKPDAIEAQRAQQIVVTARLRQQNAGARLSLFLHRIEEDGSDRTLTQMKEQEGGVYSAEITLNEQKPGRIQLRVAVTVMAQVARMAPIYSDPFFITVNPARPAKPPVSLVTARGLAAVVPPGFSWNAAVATAGGPWSVNNFAGKYLKGGVLPQDGCEIEATSISSQRTVADQMRKDLPAASSQPRIQINGRTFYQSLDHDSFGKGITYDMLGAYTQQGATIFKLFLTYRSGDNTQSACRAAFDRVLSTFQPAGGA